MAALLVAGLVALLFLLAFLTGRFLRPQSTIDHFAPLLVDAPCVAGVCPGMTDADLAMRQLSVEPLLSQLHVNEHSVLPVRTVVFTIEDGGYSWLRFREGSLEQIALQPAGDALLLRDALTVLGEPDHSLLIMEDCGWGPHVNATLFFRRGIEISIFHSVKQRQVSAWGNSIPLGQMPVGEFNYFDPNAYDQRLTSIWNRRSFYQDHITAGALHAAVQPWPGLGMPQRALDLCSGAHPKPPTPDPFERVPDIDCYPGTTWDEAAQRCIP